MQKTKKKEFSPFKVRVTLDERDDFTGNKRVAIYKLFSELAAHSTMKSAWMLRPEKNGDAQIGPFIEQTSLDAVISEMGRLGVQAGEVLAAFFPLI